MKTKLLLLCCFSTLSFSQASIADTEVTYTGVSPDSYGDNPHYETTVTPPAPSEHRHHHNHISFGFGIDDSHFAYSTDAAYTTYEVIHTGHRHHHHRTPLQWIDVSRGEPLPAGAVIGGNQPSAPHNLYICRGEYEDGVHPGKVVAGNCNIGWDGREALLPDYQVLVSNTALQWIPASYGQIPMNAIAGGSEENGTLYICRAYYRGGYHPGKVVGQNCNFGWGGREITMSHYQVLTM